MTSVIPAWKQELIEKKRKKEQEEKAKIQVQNNQIASLPEWKRILLAKKKGVQSQAVDTNNYGLGNSTVSGYDRLGQNRSSFTSSTEREYEPDLGKNAPKVIIIPKGNSQKGIQGGVKQHSFVASSVTDSDQQKKNKHLDEQLSTNNQKNFNKRETVSRFDEADSKVSYEHIKTPSELRKLFGIVSRDSVSFGSSSSDSKKIQNQQTQSNKVIPTKPYLSGTPTDYEQSHKATQNTSREISSRKVEIFSHEHDLPKSPTSAASEVQKENSAIVPEDNDAEISAHSEHDSGLKGLIVLDEEIPPEVHVNVIRTKFGPSGNFRLHKSSSSDDLLKSKHQPLSPRDKDRPPPPNHRWSADVGSILSPTKSTSDEEDMFDSDHHKKRMRSKSMGDVRVDHFHEPESVVDLRHRASISSGIERRLQELLHKLSVPDHDKNDDEDKYILDQDINDHFPDNFGSRSSTASSCEKQIDEEPRIRKASWFNPEDESKLSILHSNKADTSKDKPLMSADMTTRSSVSSSARRQPSTTSDEFKSSNTIRTEKKEKASSHNISGDKPINNQKMKPFDSGRDVVIVAKEGKQIEEEEEYSNDQEPFAVGKPVAQKTIIMNGKISQEPIYDNSEMDQKPARGSVHKLSALFGSSILKGNKKAKSKSVQEQQLNQENSSKKEKKDSRKSSSSKVFPWSKKKKPEPVTNEVAAEQTHHYSGVSSLKPVQKEVIEQKITGNMTLVINSSSGSYDSKSKQKQPLSNTHFNSNSKVPDNNRTGINSFNSITDQNSQVGVTSRSKAPPALHKPEDTMVTVIDVPDINCSNDVEVSAIDLPEPPSPTPVSVIDMPESSECDIKVSVIDIPDDDADSDDSDSSGSGMSGSYDINPVNGSDNFVATTTISEEEEEEEDIDNVPVSYVGDSTYMVVPEVIFENKLEDVKSCLSSPLRSRKRKAKVAFNPSNLVEVHDYPSEECMQYHYDQYAKENGGNTIDQYKPSCVQSLEETLKSKQTKEKVTENIRVTDNKKKDFQLSQSSEFKHEKDSAPTIMYIDEGEGFTSSSSSGALLF